MKLPFPPLIFVPILIIFITTSSFSSENKPFKTTNELEQSKHKPHQTEKGMVWIRGGEFTAGADPKVGYTECAKFYNDCKLDWFTDETPHQEKVDSFFMDQNEVIQSEYEKVIGANPSKNKGANLPVDNVTWGEADAYCKKKGKRLPTEWEWEYAALGGQSTLYPWGNQVEPGKANFCDHNCSCSWKADQFDDGYAKSSPVGEYPPNGYWLYDIAGNVWEWTTSVTVDSDGKKMVRGGSWDHAPGAMRPALRYQRPATIRYHDNGFRCAK